MAEFEWVIEKEDFKGKMLEVDIIFQNNNLFIVPPMKSYQISVSFSLWSKNWNVLENVKMYFIICKIC